MKTDIKKFIEGRIPELKGRLFPVFTTELNKVSVVYTITPVSGGHLKQSQMELKIIHPDYDTCAEFEERINALLDMENDQPFVTAGTIRFHSELAGGGILFNEGCQMFEDTLYFIIDWRYLNGKQENG